MPCFTEDIPFGKSNNLKLVPSLLDYVLTCQKAQIRYLQEEYGSLLIGGEFGKETKSIFKSLQRNTSAYTPAAIETLKMAVSINANMVNNSEF